jgi:hypothetical protein
MIITQTHTHTKERKLFLVLSLSPFTLILDELQVKFMLSFVCFPPFFLSLSILRKHFAHFVMTEFGAWASKDSNAYNVNYLYTKNVTNWCKGHVGKIIAISLQTVAR